VIFIGEGDDGRKKKRMRPAMMLSNAHDRQELPQSTAFSCVFAFFRDF